jgi:hypothetical protein
MSDSRSPPALECPRCRRHYAADERFCADCGMPLVYSGVQSPAPARSEAHARARKIHPEYARGELVRVAGGRNQAEAELIQNLLLEEGVPSMLRRTAGFDVPDFLAAGPRDVMVPESGALAARDVLLEADLAPPPPDAGRPSVGQAALVLGAILVVAAIVVAAAWLAFPPA